MAHQRRSGGFTPSPPRSLPQQCIVGGGESGGAGNNMSSDLNLIVVITEAVTPGHAGPLPQHAPHPHPHPRCRLTESCCKKRKNPPPEVSATFPLETFSAAPHSNPPQPSSSAAAAAKLSTRWADAGSLATFHLPTRTATWTWTRHWLLVAVAC